MCVPSSSPVPVCSLAELYLSSPVHLSKATETSLDVAKTEIGLHTLSEEWINNCWWSWQNRTGLGKCTHQCDETQGSNSTQALSTKSVFFGCKKRDRRQKKKEAKNRTDKKELMYKNVKNEYFLSVLFFASFFFCCLSSYTRRRPFLSKALVYYCFLVFRRIGEYISLDLFYRHYVKQ